MDFGCSIPNIRCSACGSVIGNKFIQFNRLIDCGASKLEAFQALDVRQYCCRKDFVNPIVLSNKLDQRLSPKKKASRVKILPGSSSRDLTINSPGISLNKLTDSISKEIPIVPLSYSENLNGDHLESLKQEIILSLESSNLKDIPFVRKDIDPNIVFESPFLPNKTVTDAGSGHEVFRIYRTYNAD